MKLDFSKVFQSMYDAVFPLVVTGVKPSWLPSEQFKHYIENSDNLMY